MQQPSIVVEVNRVCETARPDVSCSILNTRISLFFDDEQELRRPEDNWILPTSSFPKVTHCQLVGSHLEEAVSEVSKPLSDMLGANEQNPSEVLDLTRVMSFSAAQFPDRACKSTPR